MLAIDYQTNNPYTQEAMGWKCHLCVVGAWCNTCTYSKEGGVVKHLCHPSHFIPFYHSIPLILETHYSVQGTLWMVIGKILNYKIIYIHIIYIVSESRLQYISMDPCSSINLLKPMIFIAEKFVTKDNSTSVRRRSLHGNWYL